MVKTVSSQRAGPGFNLSPDLFSRERVLLSVFGAFPSGRSGSPTVQGYAADWKFPACKCECVCLSVSPVMDLPSVQGAGLHFAKYLLGQALVLSWRIQIMYG